MSLNQKTMGNIFFLYSSDFPQEFFFSLGVLDFCGFLHRKKIEKHKYISQKVHFDTWAMCSTINSQRAYSEIRQCVNNGKTKMNHACSQRAVGRRRQICTLIQCESILVHKVL